jgi:hypothetical protein
MSSSPLRTMVLYVGLVGVPLAGLVGVLRAGVGLAAPPAIGGAWVVEVGACPGLERLEIDQSGRFLRARAGGAASDAQLDGARITATLRPAEGPCAGQTIALHGRFTEDVLTGTLRSEACTCAPSAGPRSFRARREEP